MIASDLGMAERTLQRRLTDEGTSLRKLVEGYRRDVAEKQIKAGVQKMKIADTLVYVDTTVLWRAQKRWKPSD